MTRIKLYQIMIFFVIALVAANHTIGAEESVDRLIMSEIYLDENDPSKNWIEVYNPSDAPLTLIRLRLSTLLTPNIMNKEYKEGIEIKPKQCVVLCASENNVQGNSKENILLYEIAALRYTIMGGYIVIGTKDIPTRYRDVIRYGDAENASRLTSFKQIQVLPYLSNGNSYSRKSEIKEGNYYFKDFHETTTNPGLFTLVQ